MRLSQAIAQGTQRLSAAARGNARLDAETLLMHVLERDRAFLIAHSEESLSADQFARYGEMVERRAVGEPLQYITGHQEFWGLDFLVTPSVLIPRPETEHAVETALELLRGIESPRVVDVGTGSGCIALAIASELPQARVDAVDISEDALQVARQNASRFGLTERVRFVRSDLLSAFLGKGLLSGMLETRRAPSDERRDSTEYHTTFDIVISNPPYVGEQEAEKLQIEVRGHEPHCALFGGREGLDVYRRLIPQAREVLKPGGWLVLEIGYSQEEQVQQLLSNWTDLRSVRDLQGIPRVVAARRK
ncbi:MAG TPA: peptide chain release factor N(5)-glutamine methyltransferase [Terriglobales bacterium]|nr:peptide chain release factor N(5)-glutamine methyltransferase [Terriglobales bacterium]